jgi:hemoglobin
MNTRYFRAALATITLRVCVGIASFTVVAEPPSSLYERLGGKPAITAVVDEFVARVAADKRINGFFAGVASDASTMSFFHGAKDAEQRLLVA